MALCLVMLGITSCSKPRAPKQKFQIVSVDGISGSMNEGWRLSLTVANNTASNITLVDGWAELRHQGRNIGRVRLNGEVALPRRKCSRVEVPLRATFSLGILPHLNKIRKGDYSGLTVDYSLSVKAMHKTRTFEQSGVSLEALARQFNFGLKKREQ